MRLNLQARGLMGGCVMFNSPPTAISFSEAFNFDTVSARGLVGGSFPLEHKYIIDATAGMSKVRV